MDATLDVAVGITATLVQPSFTSWTEDETNKFNIPVGITAVLEFEGITDAGSNVVLLDRHSITMPSPGTLDALGRPNPDTFIPSDSVSTWGRLRLLFEGLDLTFFRGVPVEVLSWGSAEPGGDTVMALRLGQVSPFEALAGGYLDYIKVGQRVTLNVVGGTAKRLFTGEIISPETSVDEASGATVLHVQGILFTADNGLTPPSFHSEARDIGTVIAETLNGYGGRKYATCKAVTTGIKTRARGAWMPRLSGHVTDLLGTATTADGSSQWTVDHAGLTPSIHLKDRSTVHATVTVGTPGLSFDLASDATGAPNCIFGEGTAPDGGHWRNTKYPNLRRDSAPVYPLGGGSTFHPASGTTGFGPFAVEMRTHGYTMASGDTYSGADEAEVRDAQTRAEITVDGIVGPQTWAAVFETGSNAGSLLGAWFAPLAFDPRVMPRKYSADGADIGRNTAYDPTVMRVDRFENYGEGVTKQQATLSARAELARVSSAGVSGTMTLKIDPQEMSRFELRAGQNIKLKAYRGADVLFHIAGVQVDWPAQTVTLTVDTHARDLLTLVAIQQRNKDAATDPVRRMLPQRRSSRQTQDNTVIFDSESGAGIVPRMGLFHGLWNVVRIPAGQLGSIARTRFTTDSPAAPFAVAVFSKPITANHLVALVGDPLASSVPFSAQADALYDAGLLMAWGSTDEPAGYYPSTLTAGGSVTGRLVDDSTWYYESTQPPWLWVAVFSSSSCFVEGQLFAAPDGA